MLYVVGITQEDFPLRNAVQPALGGNNDGSWEVDLFAAKFNMALRVMPRSSTLPI
jgi:hypothetical protein